VPDRNSLGEEYVAAAALGIFPLVLDTPFGVGTVNTYLIEDEPLTLIDCGPNTATELDRLEALLAARGHAITDLELIIVTHQHVDHMGLAGTVAARSDAELVCLDRLAPLLGRWADYSAASDDTARTLMLRHGVEAHVADALRSVANVTRNFGAPSQVDRTVTDGGELRLRDRTLEVLHRPGHSASDTVLYDRANGVAVLGDHLLSRVSRRRNRSR
jgi:glyoxylase-like metal-dependent hydrolase (beta-lactamase superfamily II)